MDVLQIVLWVLFGLFALLGGVALLSMLYLRSRTRRAGEPRPKLAVAAGEFGTGKVALRDITGSRFSLVDDLSRDTWEANLPLGWVEMLDRLPPDVRADVARMLSHPDDAYWSLQLPTDRLGAALRALRMLQVSLEQDGFRGRQRSPLDEAPSQLSSEERSEVASASGASIDHALAMLFIRLGPPPEETELDYAPASSGGGGAQQ
ncbi:hypothetical protein R6L23_09610 [Streptomyces sp. SR27]|uniref:hypothetical protein n=1 Tax=Streptomyces sp. SR27 TaxID=3076630 RepID=UPI00295AC605|nr:hypothetical protein [Streptomyces sp. SR27]MDV9188467.1 hypothetical protein [Streptomyces sp. SR27]